MTENEAKKWMNTLKNWNSILPEAQEACGMAEKWFEETQQYRAMEEKLNGISVEQVVNGFINVTEKGTDEGYERGRILTNAEVDMWNEYRAIGTVARFEQLSKQFAPHNTDETSCGLRHCNKCDMYRKENEKYHEIGTIEEFKALKEKSMAKKPIHYDKHYYKCSVCDEELGDDDSFYVYDMIRPKFCCRCGTGVDWDD